MDGLCDEERGGVEKDRTSGAERGCREEGYLEEGTGTGCESLKAAQVGEGGDSGMHMPMIGAVYV